MSDELWCVVDHGHDSNGEKRQIQAAEGHLCHNHAHRLEDWLRDIEIDYALLGMELSPIKSSTDYSSNVGGGGDESAAPLNLTIVALCDAERGGAPRTRGDELWYELPDIPSILATLHARAEDIRCELDPTRDRDDTLRDITVTGEVRYLLKAFPSLAAADWVDEAFTEIKQLWIALQRAHNRPQPRAIGECLTLDCGGTVWPRPDAQPWCSRCKRIYDNTADIIKSRLEAEKRKTA